MITREFSDRLNQFFGLLFLLLAFAMLGLTISTFAAERDFARTARRTTGEVTGLVSNGTWSFVKYADAEGNEVTVQTTTRSSLDTFIVGETVEILHSEAAPRKVKLNRWFHLWGDTLPAALSSLVMGAVAVLTLSGKIRWGPLKQKRVFIGSE